jgi:hypothetical protein
MKVSSVPNNRKNRARKVRRDAAQLAFSREHPVHENNGEESDYPFIANYSKGLPHDDLGEVLPDAYQKLLTAVGSGDPADFDAIPLGGPSGKARKLISPQAGMAYDLEGPDAQAVATREENGTWISIRPAPRIDSAENSAEMAELYWMALLRNVHFSDFATDSDVAKAAGSLSLEFTDFKGPKDQMSGDVTDATLFRGVNPGELDGPYLSQFLLKDIPYGSLTISQRQETVVSGVDYLTDYNSWLTVQKGAERGPDRLDVDITGQPNRRYIRNMRDLAHYVHVDQLYEAYLNACLILLSMNAELDPGNPYGGSANQAGFATFGGPHLLSLVTEVASRVLKAVWFQKWYVHRRLRPEAFGGRVHNHKTGAKTYSMIDQEILNSSVLDEVHDRYGTYLLPQAFPEGSPTHPSYGAGHATVAGACTTVLKAWFNESQPVPDPVVPNTHGTALEPCPGSAALTVGGELNKVAGNISIGRNMAGVHWRTDYTESVRLGEALAIGIIEEQKETYNEDFQLTLTKFDGTIHQI